MVPQARQLGGASPVGICQPNGSCSVDCTPNSWQLSEGMTGTIVLFWDAALRGALQEECWELHRQEIASVHISLQLPGWRVWFSPWLPWGWLCYRWKVLGHIQKGKEEEQGPPTLFVCPGSAYLPMVSHQPESALTIQVRLSCKLYLPP